MSEIKVNKISPRAACGTTTLGDNGDVFSVPCGSKINVASGGNITIASGATITNNGTQTGFGRTGTVDWITTPKTTTFSAVSGEGYFCNTSGGAFSVNLPAGAAGGIVSLADYAETWQTHNVTVVPNGTDKIGSVNANATLQTQGQSVTFVYVDGVQGWINTMDSTSNVRGIPPFIQATGGTPSAGETSGDYKYHTFTGPGTFCISSVGPGSPVQSDEVSYIVVAGGGSGGSASANGAGGGGAGGFREGKQPSDPYTASPLDSTVSLTVTATSYPITVGGGGAQPAIPENGQSGSNSSFSTITSNSGGGAGKDHEVGQPGGSGGGGGGGNAPGEPGGTGNTPPTSPSQGFPGGTGGSPSPDRQSAGGGGATAAGTNGANPSSGPGGAGATTSINGTPTARAGGGGGGGTGDTPGASGAGGAGGGGAGGLGGSPNRGTAGTVNTGGGGGGGSCSNGGGGGGSGVVIIRYKFQ